MWGSYGFFRIVKVANSSEEGFVNVVFGGKAKFMSRRYGVYDKYITLEKTVEDKNCKVGDIADLYIETSLKYGEVIKSVESLNIIKDFADDLERKCEFPFRTNYRIFEFLKNAGYKIVDSMAYLRKKYKDYRVTENNICFSEYSLLNHIKRIVSKENNVFYDVSIDNLKFDIQYLLNNKNPIELNDNKYYICKNIVFRKEALLEYIDSTMENNIYGKFSNFKTYRHGAGSSTLADLLLIAGFEKNEYNVIKYNNFSIIGNIFYNEDSLDDNVQLTPKNIELIYDKFYKGVMKCNYSRRSDSDTTYSLDKYQGIFYHEDTITEVSCRKRESYSISGIERQIGDPLSEEEQHYLTF